jgi:hypothetical protein
LELPGDEIGISDILNYRECAQRFAWSMRRHDKTDLVPELDSAANAYGSVFHDAVEYVERDFMDDESAIDAAWPSWQAWLTPEDLDRLKSDLQAYRSRMMTGYRLLGTELELRFPLLRHADKTIFFRGRIDALYQKIDHPHIFLTRDYKSTRWPKTWEQVQKDEQQWAYNLLVHENYPECSDLVQLVDQLRAGVVPTQKTKGQREQMRAWLRQQVKAILAEEEFKPTPNDKCHFCPLVMDCRVTHRSTEWWQNKVAAMAPVRKDGRKLLLSLQPELFGMEEYVRHLAPAKQAVKVLEKYISEVERVLKEMPPDEREALGYRLGRPRRRDVFGASALRQMHDQMGDDFFQLVGVTKAAIEDWFGKGTPEASAFIELADKAEGAASLLKNSS